jgi:hypothetical protein
MKIQMDLSSLSKLDLSKIPKNLLGILLPNLPASPEHDKAYDDNLEVGRTIKRLVDEGKIRLKFDKNFKLDVITN